MKLKEALNSLHDEYSEENPFAEATNSDAEDACQPFICWKWTKKQMISKFIISIILLWLTETTKYELFFTFFPISFK